VARYNRVNACSKTILDVGEADMGRELDIRMQLDDMKAELTEEEALRFDMALRDKLRDTGTMTLLAVLGFIGIAGIHRFMLGQVGMGILYLLTGGLCWIGTIVDMARMSSMVTEYNLRTEYDELRLFQAAKAARERRAAREGPPEQGEEEAPPEEG